MRLLAVLFDLDDTLHDKSATLDRVARAQFSSFSLSKQGVALPAWIERFVALNNERIEKTEVFTQLAAKFTLPPSLEGQLREDFDENLGKLSCPFPHALEVLTELKLRGLKLGVVTNGRDAFQRSKIDGMRMTTLLDSVVTSGGFGAKKPDQSIFAACLSELKVSPAKAAFVGDDFAADMEPASALGMLAIWKSAEQSKRVAFCSPDLAQICQHLLSEA